MIPIADSSLLSLFESAGRYVAFPALLGLAVLAPLYLSQRRDLLRLRAWMEREPDHPKSDVAASEALLDRAETELEAFLAARGEPVSSTAATAVAPPSAGGATVEAPTVAPTPTPQERVTDPTGAPLTPIPAAQRVTAERPALSRITMERAALEPHPGWRRFTAQLGRPRVLALIALVAVVIGVGAVVTSRLLLEHSSSGKPTNSAAALAPRNITVAVLNGTTSPGLAGQVSRKLHRSGFRRGSVGTSRRQFQQSVVMYGGGEKKAAERVARVLGVTPVQRIDRTTRAVAGPADVVVIAGADRTGH